MTRYLYGSDIVLTAPSAPAVILAPGAPFTLWSDAAGGVKYTDCTAPDGVTALTTDQSGAFVADGSGQRPRLRGPDGVVVMWCDFGSGERFPMYAADLLHDVLAAAIDWLANGISTGGGSTGGGGLPANTTLDDIPNGATRLAMILSEKQKIANLPASFLQIGTTATTAKAGNYAPTAAEINAVQALGITNARMWFGRTTTQGPPSEAEGAIRGRDYAVLDVV